MTQSAFGSSYESSKTLLSRHFPREDVAVFECEVGVSGTEYYRMNYISYNIPLTREREISRHGRGGGDDSMSQ